MKILNYLRDLILAWTIRRSTEKELDENINLWFNNDLESPGQEDTDSKYFAGMLLLKQAVKRRAKEGSLSLEEALLEAGPRLLELARQETPEQQVFRKLQESVYVYDGADVKDEKDKEKMVDTRIGHYYELHKHKQERELLRQARKAYKDGNITLHKQLLQQWNDNYGRSRPNSKANS